MTSHSSLFLEGFKAWVRGGLGTYDWMKYLPLGDLEQIEIFSQSKS